MDAALVILDGWGLGDHDRRDAVKAADTPTVDAAVERGAAGRLDVSGRRVGLPDGQMGNSEVGHLNVGAGRVVRQPYARINDAVADGSFRENDAIRAALSHAREHGGRVHLLGLASDGGVHADVAHLEAAIRLCADAGLPAVTHAFTDGRDTEPSVADRFLARVEATALDAGTGDVATVIGRYFAMDRDGNWERTRRAYDAIVRRAADREAESGVAAVAAAHDRGETDEFVAPTLVRGGPPLADGDAVVFLNFRGDRARQLVRLLAGDPPDGAGAGTDADADLDVDPPDVRIVTMTEYDETFDHPVAFPPERPSGTLGEAVADAGLTQLRVAESEKYPHVTYFLNGGREVEVDGEQRRIVESPDVATYDEAPEMSAAGVTDAAVAVVRETDPALLVLNYANPDMVGHTGDFGATVTAVETVDRELGRLLEAVADAGGHAVVTADHGNADDMGTPENPHTAHTANPVPFVYLTPDGDGSGRTVRAGGSLCDVAPTVLALMGLPTPDGMTGESLLE